MDATMCRRGSGPDKVREYNPLISPSFPEARRLVREWKRTHFNRFLFRIINRRFGRDEDEERGYLEHLKSFSEINNIINSRKRNGKFDNSGLEGNNDVEKIGNLFDVLQNSRKAFLKVFVEYLNRHPELLAENPQQIEVPDYHPVVQEEN